MSVDNSNNSAPLSQADDFLRLISEITPQNHDQWNHLYNAIGNRVQGFHHLGLKSWDTEASCIINYYFYKAQLELNRYSSNWQNINQSRNAEQAKTLLTDFYNFIINLSKEVNSKEAVRRELQLPILLGTERALVKIDESFKNLNQNVTTDIKSGIENVLNLKSSLSLTGSFRDEITSAHESLSYKYSLLFWSQLGLILGATVLAIYFALTVSYSVENFWQIFAVKVAVAVPILLIWGFLNSEFKITRIEFIKMKHLLSLINGGASAIPQMVSESESAKHDALSKIADSFVDLKHILSSMDKSGGSGSEIDLKMIFELADKIAARAGVDSKK